ncbi:MAG: LysR family transcriptional regulator [Endozoicomonas sp. (ex Botrylloides leachii)]|nr:LysR family transcriptional regulator [Endozoicomonas sp. (ex Botrylloides leachii)]
MSDLNEILIFTKVVECGSITAAANRLGLQKSTVSRKLANLEKRLRVRLLARTTRSLRLTDIGRTHYSRCRDIIMAWEDSETSLKEAIDVPSGNMRLLIPVDLGQRLMNGIINDFLTRYPKVSIEVELSSREARLIEEGLDLIIRFGRPDDSSLIAQKIFSSPLNLYASTQFLKRCGLPSHPAELHQYACICLGTPQSDHKWLLTKGSSVFKHHPSGPLKTNNLSGALDAALAGIGIACLPSFLCHHHIEQGDLVYVLPEWKPKDGEIFALYPHRQLVPLMVRHFINFTRKKMESHKHQTSKH